MVSVQDIGELRAAFFDKAFEILIIFDSQLNVVDVSQGFVDTVRMSREQVVGKNVKEINPGVEKTDRYKVYQKVLSTGKPMILDEVVASTPQGTYHARMHIFRLGEGIGIAAQNTTDLKKVVADLSTIKDELEETNSQLAARNRDLEEISYVAAHDLKAPLTNLKSLLQILLKEQYIKEAGIDIFEKTVVVAESMFKKISSLNEMLVLKAGMGEQKEKVDLDLLLERVKGDISEQIKSAKAVIKSDFSECPVITYSQIQLHSILHNLLTNAIKYRNPKKAPKIGVKTERHGKFVKMIVSDNGVGFKSDIDQEQLFGLFKRLHTHVEGIGMGLYIVRSIVLSNGGRIEVNSRPNAGTTFTLYL